MQINIRALKEVYTCNRLAFVPREIYLISAPSFSIHPEPFLVENTPLHFEHLEENFLHTSGEILFLMSIELFQSEI
jgi:hypothetical protein